MDFLFQISTSDPTDEESLWGINKQKQLTELLIKYVTLFRFLEKEELAFFFDPAKSDDEPIFFGMGAFNLPSFRMSIDDQNVVDLLIKYVNKEIMPSPSLKRLESNKFKTDEEMRFHRERFATWTAIIISILLGSYGIYGNYENNKRQQNQFNTQLKENLKITDSIISRVSEIEASNYRPMIKKISESLAKISERGDFAPRKEAPKQKN